jgi:hypothetical protein
MKRARRPDAEVQGDLLTIERDESFFVERRRRKICRASIAATSTRSRYSVCRSSPHRAQIFVVVAVTILY